MDFTREIIHSIKTSTIIAAFTLFLMYSPVHTYTRIYEDLYTYPMWWFFLSILLALMVQDSYFYWTHRAMHHPKVFKWVHLLHHRSVNPSPLASQSFHVFEAVLELLIAPIIIIIIPLHPYAILAFITTSFVFNAYGHLGYEIAPRWFRRSILFEVLSTSVYHNLHHKKFKGNYGLYFRFWDRVMKTESPDYVVEYDAIQERRFGKMKTSSSMPLKQAGIFIFFLIGLGCMVAFGQHSIEGIWKDNKEGGLVKITERDGKYYGQLIGAEDPKEDEEIRNGDDIWVIIGFVKKDDKIFCCGNLYHPKFRLTTNGKLEMIDPQSLKVYGWYGFIRSTRVWKRV
ncbi:MAG: sterol desaturase family protein [Bacteroidia bacterium]|nr:sterol desaturase family protein [Bacteroidia bacterium]